MDTDAIKPLVHCEWLSSQLHAPDVAILDATFFLPNQSRDAGQEYRVEHVPGARFFDIDAVADRSSPLPHMLPSPDFFAESVGRLGIGNATHVVVYDNNSFMAAARAWWMFRIFGHQRVSVLDGGLRRWKAAQLPLASGEADARATSRYEAGFRPELVRNLDAMKTLLETREAQIIDARSPGRFAGTEPEPRPGVRSGHIPGSRNIPFKALVDEATGQLKATTGLDREFHARGIRLDRPIVTTCGTGVTAAILALGLFRLGRADVPVYDGSWTEWGGRVDTPVEQAG